MSATQKETGAGRTGICWQVSGTAMRVFCRSGNENIRLGNFRTDDGESFSETRRPSSHHLRAEVRSGVRWVDFPGTYTAVSFVASNRAFEVLREFRVDESVHWLKTVVQGADRDPEFWTMGIWDATMYRILDPTALDPFEPRYKYAQNRDDCDVDFCVDESLEMLLSDRLADALTQAGCCGFRTEVIS